MKGNVPPWAIGIAIVVAVAVIGFLGYKQLKPPEAMSSTSGSPPPSFIDPVTHRPKGMGAGSGMPVAPKSGGASAPAAGGQ